MFGANPLRKVDLSDGSTLLVHSVFGTIQGEGPFAGHPAVFVRLGGCNLACLYCDTEFEGSSLETLSIETLAERVASEAPRTSLIVLTGGEPMRQQINPFVRLMVGRGWKIQIETAGTVWPRGLSMEGVHLVCSPKTGKVHTMVEYHCRDWKYIVSEDDSDPIDGLPVRSTQVAGRFVRIYRPGREDDQVWVQPKDSYIDPDTPAVDMNIRNQAFAASLAMKYGYRLSLQTHKILGLP